MAGYHRLQVARVEPATDAAKSVELAVPDELRSLFDWRPGQHLNFRFHLAGEELRRSYSISSSPIGGPLRITVKRVRDGRVSNHINDNLKPGDTVEVMPPAGGFCLDPSETDRRTHYFFGAGSGITPLFSMLSSVLLAEPHSFAYLLYGNRDATTVIFRDELADLCEKYGERCAVTHTLSSPSMWSSFDAWKGIVDPDAVRRFIDLHPPYAQDAQYYICGPGGMNASVKEALRGLDVPAERIHMESYGGAIEVDETIEGVAAVATIELAGESHRVAIPQGRTVLRAILDVGLEAPYSCEAGVCSTCRAQLQGGTVHLRSRMALEDAEIEAGAILTCQAVPTSTEISVSYGRST